MTRSKTVGNTAGLLLPKTWHISHHEEIYKNKRNFGAVAYYKTRFCPYLPSEEVGHNFRMANNFRMRHWESRSSLLSITINSKGCLELMRALNYPLLATISFLDIYATQLNHQVLFPLLWKSSTRRHISYTSQARAFICRNLSARPY